MLLLQINAQIRRQFWNVCKHSQKSLIKYGAGEKKWQVEAGNVKTMRSLTHHYKLKFAANNRKKKASIVHIRFL